MPQIFPAWMSSPFFTYFLYAVAGLLILHAVRLLFRRNWRGLAGYIGVLVVLALVGQTVFSGYMKYLFKDFQFQMPPAGVQVQTVALHDFDDRIDALGTTQANESASLTTRVTGIIREINVAEGQFVPAGTVIARLQDDEEQATLVEAEKSFNRSVDLARTSAISTSRLDSDRARLAIARSQVNDRQIVAPFDGILGLRSVSVGDIVNPGTVLTTLDNINPIKLEFSVPEAQMAHVQVGQTITAHTVAYPGQIFSGRITAVDPRLDPVTRALRAKAEIPNPAGNLRAGMLMNLSIIRNARQALAISEEAVQSQGTKKSVLVAGALNEGGLSDIEERDITIGTRRAGYVEVLSGLQAGEKVVVDGVIKARAGGKVKITGDLPIQETVQRATGVAVTGKQTELMNQDTREQQTDPEAPTPKAPDAPQDTPQNEGAE